MAELDKVIKAWECCNPLNRRCFECPYDADCFHDSFDRVAIADMVKLLKERQPIVRCVNCISRIPAKDPDCTVCNNPKSPCYQREIRDSDFCAWGKDGDGE